MSKIVDKRFMQPEGRSANIEHNNYQTDAQVTDSEVIALPIDLSAQETAAWIRADAVHDPLRNIIDTARAKLERLGRVERVEIDALELMDVFWLPLQPLCDELMGLYFEWVAPIIPVINKAQFMEQYDSKDKPPSLLLLQAVLLAGSKAHRALGLLQSDGLPSPIIRRIYRSVKALYRAEVEDDPIITVQALILMGWYCGDLEDTTQNPAHWTTFAIVEAQARRMHQSVDRTGLSIEEKQLRKRIWWTLYTLDRSTAINIGRPLLIYGGSYNMELIGPEDFIDSQKVAIDPLHVLFFLEYRKLCIIMGMILTQPRTQSNNDTIISTCDPALKDWLQNCPSELHWESTSHNFWSALLQASYNATLCVLHGTKLNAEHARDLSSITACNAATRIIYIGAALCAHEELHKCPASFANNLLRALIIYVVDAKIHVQMQQVPAEVCLGVLKSISRVWAIPKRQYARLESAIKKIAADKISNAEPRKLAQQTYPDDGRESGQVAVYGYSMPGPGIIQSSEPCIESWANTGQNDSSLLQSGQDPNIRLLPLQPIENAQYIPQMTQEPPNSLFNMNNCGLSQPDMYEALTDSNKTGAWGQSADFHGFAPYISDSLVSLFTN